MSFGLWQIAGILAAVAAVVLLIRWYHRSVKQSGRDDQKAIDAQAELEEHKTADHKAAKAADEFAKKGGADEALKKGEF